MEEIWRGGVPDDDLVLVRYETDEPLEYMVELFYGGGTSGPRVATTAAARGLAAALLRWADMVDGVNGTGGVRECEATITTSSPGSVGALTTQVAGVLASALDERGVRRSELARRMGVTPSAVTQLLDGANLTLHKLAEMADAIGYDVNVTLIPQPAVHQ